MFHRFIATLKCPAVLNRGKQVNPKIHGEFLRTVKAQEVFRISKMNKAMN